jgi:hypothetical protein
LIWFNNVITSVIEVAWVSLLKHAGAVSPKQFMMTLLATISKREFLDPMNRTGILEVPAPFMEAFISKIIPHKGDDSEASEFGQFLLLACEHSCQAGDAANSLFLQMFVRPLCDVKCSSIFTRSKSSWPFNASSGFDDLMKFHSEVSRTLPAFFDSLEPKFSPDLIHQVGGKIIEYWESAVWKLLQNKMEDLARGDSSRFISILPNNSSRTTLLCVYLQAGIKNLFSSGNFDDHGSIGRLGAVWIKMFDTHASSARDLGLNWEDYVQKQSPKEIVSQSFAEQSTALGLRPFCEVLKEVIIQCNKNRNASNYRCVEKANSAASLLITQLFVALASSQGLNDLVKSLPSAGWSRPQIPILLRRVFDQNPTFFEHMLSSSISIPAHSYFDQRLASAESDLRLRGNPETSLYFQVSQTWADIMFNEISNTRKSNSSSASIVRSMCESLFAMCLRPQLASVSCCAAEFSVAVLNEACKRLQPPHRFAVVAEIASIPALLQFLQTCDAVADFDKSKMTLSQQRLIESANSFRSGILYLLLELSENNITEPELKCLEAPADRHSSLDMAGFLRLPGALFPDTDWSGITQRDLLTKLRSHFDTWKADNKRDYTIFCFLSQFFGRSCIPPQVVPIPPLPITPPAVLDGKMLKDLMKNHDDFVKHLSRQYRIFSNTPESRVHDAKQLHPQLKHFCDCSLFKRQFHAELQKFRMKYQIPDNDTTVCAHVTDAVLASIEALFIRPNTTFHELIKLVSTGDDGAVSVNTFSSRTITLEKEVTIIESWFSDASTGAQRVNTERVKSASKILQYRTKVGEASGALKSLHLISSKAIRTMDDALGVNIPGQLMERLHDNTATLADASPLLNEIGHVFAGMEPSALDLIIHIEKAKAALNFLKQQDVSAEFNVKWTNAESRAMGNPFITSVLDKLDAVRKFLKPLYDRRNEMDMAKLAAHLWKFSHAAKIEELKDQLNTVAQQWSNVEWYFHSGDNQATLALLGHFEKSGRFQSMGKGCSDGPAIRFCFRMGEAAEEQYPPPCACLHLQHHTL